MESSLISVIIPIYNVQQYLSQCVESILAQTYQNLEIILVDDGSTDDSGRMCDALTQRDNRIQVIHKPNGGLSDARNAGTKACNGAFVFYLDSDDYLEQDAISALVRIQKDLKRRRLRREKNIDCFPRHGDWWGGAGIAGIAGKHRPCTGFGGFVPAAP